MWIPGKRVETFLFQDVYIQVRPVALREVPVFTENSREYTLIRTEKFGTVVPDGSWRNACWADCQS